MGDDKEEKGHKKRRRSGRVRLVCAFPFPFEVNLSEEDDGDEGEDPTIEMGSLLSYFFPHAARQHIGRARVEFLKAIRACIDERIRTIEDAAARPAQRVEKVRVDVEDEDDS